MKVILKFLTYIPKGLFNKWNLEKEQMEFKVLGESKVGDFCNQSAQKNFPRSEYTRKDNEEESGLAQGSGFAPSVSPAWRLVPCYEALWQAS